MKYRYNYEILNVELIDKRRNHCTATIEVHNAKTDKIVLSAKLSWKIMSEELEDWYDDYDEDHVYTKDEIEDCAYNMLVGVFDGANSIKRFKELIEYCQN